LRTALSFFCTTATRRPGCVCGHCWLAPVHEGHECSARLQDEPSTRHTAGARGGDTSWVLRACLAWHRPQQQQQQQTLSAARRPLRSRRADVLCCVCICVRAAGGTQWAVWHARV
jgi:hypothetical protein